jgi:hypothetical protein
LRRENTDFEVPFFDDEDNGQHERSYFEVVRQQKSMFKRQREELSKMEHSAASAGSSAFSRILQRDLALKWVADEKKKVGIADNNTQAKSKISTSSKAKKDTATDSAETAPSSVLAKLDAEGRSPFQLKLSKPKPRKKRKRPALMFDEEEEEEESL